MPFRLSQFTIDSGRIADLLLRKRRLWSRAAEIAHSLTILCEVRDGSRVILIGFSPDRTGGCQLFLHLRKADNMAVVPIAS